MEKFDCVIIGAGLAGCFAAYYLSLSSRNCLILDSNQIASGASGNDLGGLMPYITHPTFIGHNLYKSGFELTFSLVNEFKDRLLSASFTKAAQFPSNERPKKLFDDKHVDDSLGFVLNPREASKIIGMTPSSSVYVYNNALVLSPPELCQFLLQTSNCTSITQSEVVSFKRLNSGFEINTESSTYLADNVIISNAFDCSIFPECSFFPVKKVRGQVVSFDPQLGLEQVKIPLCYNGYFLPATDGKKALLGTTYDYSFLSQLPCAERNIKMFNTLCTWIPECKAQNLSIEKTRVSFRTVSKDRMPIAGKLADRVFISVGHGSRGLHSAGVCAKYICSLVNQQPFEQTIADAIDPMRKTLS